MKIVNLTAGLVIFSICQLSFAQNESTSLVAPGAEIQKIDNTFAFVEGPVTDTEGSVFFTDIRNNRIHKFDIDGTLSTVRKNSNASNGLIFDGDGNLLACEGGANRITSMNEAGEISVVVEEYNGKPFNSPNDLWIDDKGGIYFTDPNYSGADNLTQDGEHVYYISPDRNTVTRVVSDMGKPNGIIGTKDNKRLYIADTQLAKVFAFDINADASLSPKREFVDSASDGITLDEFGNLYITWRNGVEIYNPEGKLLEVIEVPEWPANVGFAGKNRNVLFIPARTGMYYLQMTAKGQQ